MLFNSLEFLLFLPIVFFLYWFVFKSRTKRNAFIVFASYVFYGWWDYRFLLLIAFTSLCSWWFGLLIERKRENKKFSLFLSASNIIINISILVVFKYFNFFLDSFLSLLGALGFEMGSPLALKIILPVGISFYTFQALSYTIDIYRGRIKATNSIIDFFAFISFFPQLVAGPIERAKDLLPQFQKNTTFSYPFAVEGARQMLWGFFKKIVIADNCAIIVDDIFANYMEQSASVLILGALLFSFQIYCDFSGYSDIAIGTAKLFGIRLNKNFDFPYFSRNIAEFWRRWHISLMTWLRDYIYFPLGGSKKGVFITIVNTFIVFFISGLWHGASWTFVLWGLYHALLINILTLLHIKKKYISSPSLKDMPKILLTFVFVVFGWIMFRAESVTFFFGYVEKMFVSPLDINNILKGKYIKVLFFVFVMLVVEWMQREKDFALQFSNKGLLKFRFIRWALYYIIFLTIITMQGEGQNFIYFQF